MTRHRQRTLFDDTPAQAVSVVDALEGHKPTDRQQATFQRLLRQIDEQRALLAGWNAYLPRYNQRLSNELLPLYDQIRDLRRSMARLLDTQWDRRVLRGKVQQARLQKLLVRLVEDLLEEGADSELEALYQKHRQISFSEQKAAAMFEQRAMLEQAFGIELDDMPEVADLDALVRHIHDKLAASLGEGGAPAEPGEFSPPPRRKSARQQAAELRKEADAKAVSQTVREVYRKLASALHPDRETDQTIRDRKTEQMQRVNQAYEAGDLLGLLNLQFEIEQIDTHHLTSLPAERLTHYNRVLREQLAELKAEVEAVTMRFRHLCPWQKKLLPRHVDHEMNIDIARLGQEIGAIQQDLVILQDPAELKVFVQTLGPHVDADPVMPVRPGDAPMSRPARKPGRQKAAGKR